MNFEEIYEAYSQAVYRLCLGYTNDAEKAKDIVQDSFISVWKNLESFRGESQIGTWIYRIATNHCIKAMNKEKRQQARNLEIPRLQIEAKENSNIILLRKYISALPEVDRLIISMELEEIPQNQIAEILGISHGNIRVRVHRIKEKLSQSFKKENHV